MELPNPRKSLYDDTQEFKIYLEGLKKQPRPYRSPLRRSERVEDRTEDEKQRRDRLGNDDFEQDISLRKKTLLILFIFLGCETAVVFLIALLQGYSCDNFYLEEWSFRILLLATISQITAMLVIAVKYLFPKK